MELPEDSMGEFYKREWPKVDPVVPRRPGPLTQDLSTAISKAFNELEDDDGKKEQYSAGVKGLKGCTSLFIISRKGVYATHWWEDVSFDPQLEYLVEPVETKDKLFKHTVIDVLTTGGTRHPKLDAAMIEDQYIQAYLIHPTQTWAEAGPIDVGYIDRWDSIRKTVGELVPTLDRCPVPGGR